MESKRWSNCVQIVAHAFILAALSALCVYKFLLQAALYVPARCLRMAGALPAVPAVIRTPETRFDARLLASQGYAFAPRYLDVEGVRMHYLDEGPRDGQARETVLLLHGEAVWCFLYRKVIPALVAQGFRVVAPDFIGFGRSDKYTSLAAYTQDMHCASLAALVSRLNLTNVTLVGQDWGCLTGLAVFRDPRFVPRLARLVIINTALPSSDEIASSLHMAAQWPALVRLSVARLVERPLPSLLLLTWRMAAALLEKTLPVAPVINFGTFISPSSQLLDCYEAPFHCRHARAGVAKWPLLLPIFPWMALAKVLSLCFSTTLLPSPLPLSLSSPSLTLLSLPLSPCSLSVLFPLFASFI